MAHKGSIGAIEVPAVRPNVRHMWLSAAISRWWSPEETFCNLSNSVFIRNLILIELGMGICAHIAQSALAISHHRQIQARLDWTLGKCPFAKAPRKQNKTKKLTTWRKKVSMYFFHNLPLQFYYRLMRPYTIFIIIFFRLCHWLNDVLRTRLMITIGRTHAVDGRSFRCPNAE